MQLSHHAIAQMRQRAISEKTVDYLVAWGRKAYDHQGAIIHFFDKSTRAQLLKRIGERQVRQIERQLDAYAVVSTKGEVITVGHRYKRINRH